MKDIIVSFCDYTGKFVQPWVENGYRAILIDPQHEPGVTTDGRITRVGRIIDHPETYEVLRWALPYVCFVGGFPPCTDVAVSGSRWFDEKRKADPHFQAKAALVAEQCRFYGKLSGAPWVFENPVSVFSSIFGKPTFTFQPWHYTGYCPEDNYTKTTCLWAGNNFRLPPPLVAQGLPEPDDRIHRAAPGPERANFRSATPLGFSLAVFREHGDL